MNHQQLSCLAALILSADRTTAVLPLDPEGPYNTDPDGEIFPLDPDYDPMPPLGETWTPSWER